MSTRSRSFRLGSETLDALDRSARWEGVSANQLAARLLDEGLRMRDFPGVGFTTSRMGHRAVLLGTRLAVWEVVATLRAHAGDTSAAAADLALTHAQVEVCARYYATYQGEVDDLVAELERMEAVERDIHTRRSGLFG